MSLSKRQSSRDGVDLTDERIPPLPHTASEDGPGDVCPSQRVAPIATDYLPSGDSAAADLPLDIKAARRR
ncbi:hypothetical protein BaRGS_00022529 [Batillaria attramentaria]|uniref:Uncharacterized protein n=1 Tax=Batillaria attramentaria TaxID=370345 RepID=A0ABD0KG71_9CAEN